ncbi:MAG: 1-acyl-sn-glycerol-3-phosphate acyltransferase [Cytophagaceae bacterium]|jgi:hypothetical protein|nr:1-acyl-sn-glycerol-3-phosphate acyltransferase [Cytophagaceae bacterium]
MSNYQISDFELIRPYNDDEIQSVFKRLLSEEAFVRLLSFLYPASLEKTVERISKITSIRQFQEEVISSYVKGVIENTTQGVFAEGLENLLPNESYLFFSNHRDIILDPAILNVLLVQNGFDTTEIAIGDNLLIFPWITDLVKLNRTFIVNRNLPVKQMLESSSRLSNYIRYTLTEKNSSVWIAQREGRSKDGNDRTQISLLKMLNISGTGSFPQNFKELKIVPVSIAYEYDPCDYLKSEGFLKRKKNPNYQKTKDEDLKHMETGLKGRKGRVSFSFGKPINEELQAIEPLTVKNDQFTALAETIDRYIHLNYHLCPGNYVAWDVLNQKEDYQNFYTAADKEYFLSYIEEHLHRCNRHGADSEFIRETLLEMYANPVENKRNCF